MLLDIELAQKSQVIRTLICLETPSEIMLSAVVLVPLKWKFDCCYAILRDKSNVLKV